MCPPCFGILQFIPLIPLRSYVIQEGSEQGGGFQVVRIPLNLKSVLTGYLRGWLGIVAIFSGCLGALVTTWFYLNDENSGIALPVTAIAIMVGVLWFILMTKSRWFLPVQLVLLLVSTVVYFDVPKQAANAVPVPGSQPGALERRRDTASYVYTLLIANAAALLFSLTRLLTPVSYDRAFELGALLGFTPEQITDHLEGRLISNLLSEDSQTASCTPIQNSSNSPS